MRPDCLPDETLAYLQSWQVHACDDWVGACDDSMATSELDQSGPLWPLRWNSQAYSATGAHKWDRLPFDQWPSWGDAWDDVDNVRRCVTDNEMMASSCNPLAFDDQYTDARTTGWRTTSTSWARRSMPGVILVTSWHFQTHCHPPDYRGRATDMLIGPMEPQQMGKS